MSHARQDGPGDFIGIYTDADGKRRKIGFYDTPADAILDAAEESGEPLPPARRKRPLAVTDDDIERARQEHPDNLWAAFEPRETAILSEADGQQIADLLVAAIRPPERRKF